MQRVKQVPFTRIFRSSKTNILFIYTHTHTHYFNIGEIVHIGVETRRTRSSNVSRSDSRQWICTHPVDGAVYRTIPRPTSSRRDTRTCVYGQSQGVLWSNARGEKERDRYIYIYKSSLFSPRSESTNPPAEQTHAEPIYTFERSNVLPYFPPPMRALEEEKFQPNLQENPLKYSIFIFLFKFRKKL